MSSRDEAKLTEYWRRWREGRDGDARDALLEHYLYIPERTVARFLRQLVSKPDWDDARAWATLGMIKAIERFDPDRNDDFVGYAFQMVWWELIEWTRREDWVPKRTRSRIAKGEEIQVSVQVPLMEHWDQAEEVEDEGMGPEARLFAKMQDEALSRYARTLPSPDRELLEDWFANLMTETEMDQRYGKETVRRVLMDALDHLKEKK